MQKSLPLSSPTFSFHGFLRVHAVFLPCAFSCHLDTHGKQRVLPRESFSFLLFPYRNKVKMLISVAKIRQVSEFAKLLAEILSEVAKRRNGSQRWLPFLYSHLWGTGTHTQVPDPMTIAGKAHRGSDPLCAEKGLIGLEVRVEEIQNLADALHLVVVGGRLTVDAGALRLAGLDVLPYIIYL